MLRLGLMISLALAPLVLSAGCDLPGCGAPYKGAGDRVYQNATDQLILCSNGGFVAMANGAVTLQGRWSESAVPGSSPPDYSDATGTDSETGSVDFVLSDNTDGTATIPQLAPGEWQQLSPDPAELGHYDYYCEQLTSQSWWTSGSNASIN
jgi:hypothetical protein